MSWTDPRTWTAGETVTASIMNTHIRDNLNALKAPPTDTYKTDEGSNYTTTSTSFVDVDTTGTELEMTITTTGGDVAIGFSGTVQNSSGFVFFDITTDGNAWGSDDGILRAVSTGFGAQSVSFLVWEESLSAGSHTFVLRWKVSASTGTLFAGAGGANQDVHSYFWAREMS